MKIQMRRLLVLVFVFNTMVGHTQTRLKEDDPEQQYKEQRERKREMQKKWKPVSVGEKMPDISLGTVVNNVTGKKRFSDFKGKLIILDFWDTMCSSCIAAFPHMSELQEKYKDKIQVFLVNHFETQEDIERNLARIYENKKIVFPANLPSIVNGKYGDNVLNYLFPPKGETGYHIWVDGNGVVRLRGNGPENTYEEKIDDLLAGKAISYVSDEGVRAYESEKAGAWTSLIPKVNRPVLQYNSVITQLTEELAPYFGTITKNMYDSSTGTVRNSFLNQSIENLYYQAFLKTIEDEWRSNLTLNYVQYFPIRAKDVAIYTGRNDARNIVVPKPDEWRRQHAYCYEQIAPASLSDAQRRQFMVEDLNRYFGATYGIEGKLEKFTTDCWVIVNTTNSDKVKTKAVNNRQVYNKVTKGRKAFVEFINYPIADVLSVIINENKEYFKSINIPIFNGMEQNERVDIVVPMEINSIEVFQKILLSMGLDLIKQKKELTRMVIEE